MRKVKKVWIILISIIIFLIITNPSPSRYKEYCGCPHTAKRDYNFFIFSIYEGYYPDRIPAYYLGIALNFFKVEDL
jgi:hypothetical protein